MIFYILIGIILILLLLIIVYQNTRFCRLINKIPGPKAYPIVGNLLIFNVPVEQQWAKVRELSNKYKPFFKVWMGPINPIVSISDPDDLEILLTSQKSIAKGMSYNYLHPWLKSGLLTSDGNKWRQRRKMLTPAFHFNILKKYMDITNENGIRFIESLRNEGTESVHSLVNLCSKYTLNIILESAMGIALDKVDKETADEYKTAVYDTGIIVAYRIARPYIQDWMINPLWKLGRIQKRGLKTLSNFSTKVIQERREYHKKTQNIFLNASVHDTLDPDGIDHIYTNGRKRLAMLDLLLAAEQENLIDNEGIKEEIDTFTFEGHDTTAMSMVFTLLLLANNKAAQSMARAEVIEVLDKSQGRLGMSETQELCFLERCIKESLRLYPPVATFTRTTSEDIQFKNYLVPADAEVWVQLFDIHRNPDNWEDPEKFDPDRFLPERSQGRHPFSYIPFSAGPRNCIGQKFAMMELKSLIGRILYNFELEPIQQLSEMQLLLDIIIRPLKPVFLKFVRIDK